MNVYNKLIPTFSILALTVYIMYTIKNSEPHLGGQASQNQQACYTPKSSTAYV